MSSKLDDPVWRQERARKAAEARTNLDYHVNKVVEGWPDLSDESVAKLSALLADTTGDSNGGRDA